MAKRHILAVPLPPFYLEVGGGLGIEQEIQSEGRMGPVVALALPGATTVSWCWNYSAEPLESLSTVISITCESFFELFSNSRLSHESKAMAAP